MLTQFSSVISLFLGGNSLGCLLSEWSEDDPAPATVMLISRCYTMANSCFFQSTGSKYNFFCVYPKDRRPVTLDNVPEYKKAYVREKFVWENLLNDNMNNACEMMNDDDDPLFICEICNDLFKICGEFITHLKSEEHIEQVRTLAASILSSFVLLLCKTVT